AWNLPAWSLSVEAVLYCAFPLLIPPCFRWRLWPAMVVAITLVLACSLSRLALFDRDASVWWANFWRYFPAVHIPQFILGIVTCRLFLFGPSISEGARRSVVVAGAVIVIAIFATGMPTWARADFVLGPLFAAIIFGATY